MVDLSCSNKKLRKRGVRIVRDVTRLAEPEAAALLRRADGQVKTALAMGVLGVDRRKAEKALRDHHGFLRRLFRQPHHKNPRISGVFFDMDGTILAYELPNGFSTWAALGWAFGIYERMSGWVDDYLAKRASYESIWRACARDIKGRNFIEIREVLFPCSDAPPFSRGFPECVAALRNHYRLGIVSSGLSMVSEEIRKRLELDFEVSNRLGLTQGTFDGTYEIRVPFDRKLEVLEKTAARLRIPLSEICFVGDSPNDIPALEKVGLPVAYNPKDPSVVRAARGNVIGDFLQLPRLIERFAS
jgi:HAD superfamily phosphoserine phosphatase-like hydrolase